MCMCIYINKQMLNNLTLTLNTTNYKPSTKILLTILSLLIIVGLINSLQAYWYIFCKYRTSALVQTSYEQYKQYKIQLPDRSIIVLFSNIVVWLIGGIGVSNYGVNSSISTNKNINTNMNMNKSISKLHTHTHPYIHTYRYSTSQYNHLICGILIVTSHLCYDLSAPLLGHQYTISYKIYSLLCVSVIGCYYSSVPTTSRYKLHRQQVLAMIVAVVGAQLCWYYMQQQNIQPITTNTSMILVIFVILSCVIDGLLYDRLAALRLGLIDTDIDTDSDNGLEGLGSQLYTYKHHHSIGYRVSELQLMAGINKYIALCMLVWMLLLGSFKISVIYIVTHFWFIGYMLVHAGLTAAMYYVVYRGVINYRQHVVPMVILAYAYIKMAVMMYASIGVMEVVGLGVVLGAIGYQILGEIKNEERNQRSI